MKQICTRRYNFIRFLTLGALYYALMAATLAIVAIAMAVSYSLSFWIPVIGVASLNAFKASVAVVVLNLIFLWLLLEYIKLRLQVLMACFERNHQQYTDYIVCQNHVRAAYDRLVILNNQVIAATAFALLMVWQPNTPFIVISMAVGLAVSVAVYSANLLIMRSDLHQGLQGDNCLI